MDTMPQIFGTNGGRGTPYGRPLPTLAMEILSCIGYRVYSGRGGNTLLLATPDSDDGDIRFGALGPIVLLRFLPTLQIEPPFVRGTIGVAIGCGPIHP